MTLRKIFSDNRPLGLAVGVLLILGGVTAIYMQNRPVPKADLNQVYYTTDDGKTWFADSTYRIAPFEHEGKTAVIAQVYSYAEGSKQFCAYVAKYTPDAKKRLEEAIASAKTKGEDPGSVALFRDRTFMNSAMEVKQIGEDKEWIPFNDIRARNVFSIRSPDGSEVDQVFVY